MIELADPFSRPGCAREFRCTVHGLCFENRWHKLESIHAGDRLVLQREPENAIGADAIRVGNADLGTIGYVPRTISRWLAPLMDRGYQPEASVIKVRSGCPYYERLLISVTLR
jgi:hypothetical protein